MTEVLIRKWGDIWHVRDCEGSSTTTDAFSHCVVWAMANEDPGGPGVLIRIGHPIPESESP